MSTLVTVEVDVVHLGDLKTGDEIVVVQTGGTAGGFTLDVADEVPLKVDGRYLLFAEDSLDGAYVVLGGSAGTYLAEPGDVFTAVRPESAPFHSIAKQEIASLLG